MKKIRILMIVIALLVMPVSAADLTAPEISNEYMPADVEDFSDGLWFVIKSAINDVAPNVRDAGGVCLSIIAISMLTSMLTTTFSSGKQIVTFVGVLGISTILFTTSQTFITLGVDTVQELSQYGKLLLPVMTAAMAATGGTTTSTALYTGTTIFNTVLMSVLTKLVVPLIYIYLCVSIARCILPENILDNVKKFAKWLIQWCLKLSIYIFTGYLSITGVISGHVDAATLKATKIAISGFVPVVGGVISDASETILVSAGLLKSAAGVYGGLAILALWIGPFLQIGIQYLMLKMTGAICCAFNCKEIADIVNDFTTALGFVLGMTVTICVLLLVSTVCFMKGVS